MTTKPQLSKKTFQQYVGNIYYFKRFESNNKQYELCFEPCGSGFDVALYERYGENNPVTLVFPRICTEDPGYADDSFGLKDRREETWELALQIAEEILVQI